MLNPRNKIQSFGVVLMMSLALAHCAPGQDSDLGTAALRVHQAALSGSIARLAVTVSGPGMAQSIKKELSLSGGKWVGSIDKIPAGRDRKFVAIAYDGGDDVLFDGEAAGVEIVGGKTTSVMIVLQQVTPPKPFHNTIPFIDALTASPIALEPGQVATLKVKAHDIDPNDALHYTWNAAAGAFDSKTDAEVKWTAPQALGKHRITLTVSDTQGGDIVVSVDLEVVGPSEGIAKIEAQINHWPTISRVLTLPGRVDAGNMAALNILASDLDGDSLSYSWSDEGGECAGKFSDAKAKDPVWTAPAKAPSKGTCSLTVRVIDGKGGTNVGSLSLQVGSKLVFTPGDADTEPPVTTPNHDPGVLVPFGTSIQLSCKDSGSGCARIVYTTDGSTPSFDPPNGTIVKGGLAEVPTQMLPFDSMTLKFAAQDFAGNVETVKEATFVSQ